MKMSQRFVLLLGAILSASSIGCSVISAVVSDYRPASREGRGSAERMVAIGRVFANQGKYDQAEAMFRRAIREKPSDPAIHEQLQRLAQLREGHTFGTDATSSAIAMADGVSSRTSAAHRRELSATESSASTGRAVLRTDAAAMNEYDRQPAAGVKLTSASDDSVSAGNDASESGAVVAAVASSQPAATVVREGSGRSAETQVTGEEILNVMDSPADNADLLLNGLKNGDLLETQCLAATLLGDCDPGDERIRAALEQASQTANDPRLLLAISDSRIQRNEGDTSTADCLIELIEEETGVTQIQALSDIRYFAGTESNDECVAILQSLLDHDDASIRATAALTLGDFPGLDEATTARLSTMASADESSEVRDAAKAAISRSEPSDIDETDTMILDPL